MGKTKLFTSLFCACIAALLIESCQKDSRQITQSAGEGVITGNWELRQLSAGIGVRNYPPGNGSVYIFTGTDYSILENNKLVKKGHYCIVADSTVKYQTSFAVMAGQFTQRIIFDNDSTFYNGTYTKKNFFQINGSRLIFIAGYFPDVPFADGVAQTIYEKQ